MENKLRNISLIVNKYKLHILDLVHYTTANVDEKHSNKIFKSIFSSIFSKIRDQDSKLPPYLDIYDSAIEVLKSHRKVLDKKLRKTNLDEKINIEDYNTKNHKDIKLKDLMSYLNLEDRIIANLALRHKISLEELSTLLKTTPGTILSRITNIKTELARAIIRQSSKEKTPTKEDSKDCFYTRNMKVRYDYKLVSSNENSRLKKHINKCPACSRFALWHDYIHKLIENDTAPVPSRQLSAKIFYRLSKRSFMTNLWYGLYRSWLSRTLVLTGLSAFVVLAGFNYYFDNGEDMLASAKATDGSQKVLDNDNITLKPQRVVSYKIRTSTRRRITVTRLLNELLVKLEATPTEDTARGANQRTFNMEMRGGTSYFNVRIRTDKMQDFLSEIKDIDDFDIVRHEELIYTTSEVNYVNVEIRVTRRNV